MKNLTRTNRCFKIVIALAIIAAIFATVSLTVWAKEEPITKGFVNVETTLNLRKEPLLNAEVVRQLYPGEVVTINFTSENNQWCYLELEDGTVGYAAREFIVKQDELVDVNEYELISAAVITSSSSANRDFNLARASQSIDGTELKPGDIFAWFETRVNGKKVNGVVGSASKANGYKEATVISGGKYVKGYGGGVCQVSTAVYNCIHRLDIVSIEHHHHSLKSSYVAPGMDATIAYPSKNFVFENTLDYTIMLRAYAEGGCVTVCAFRPVE